jgi:hypothetical protein
VHLFILLYKYILLEYISCSLTEILIMSQSDGSDSGIPDRDTCQKLTEQFAEVTGTDEACAQFYLQDRKWDLEVRMK